MNAIDPYWHDDVERKLPFSILLAFLEAYCHPEAIDINYPSLVLRARKDPVDDPEMRAFKDELTRVLLGELDGLHPQAITSATWYEDEDDTAFLKRLWLDLYPNEPIPGEA